MPQNILSIAARLKTTDQLGEFVYSNTLIARQQKRLHQQNSIFLSHQSLLGKFLKGGPIGLVDHISTCDHFN